MSLQRNIVVLLASCLAFTLASNTNTHGSTAELSLLSFMSRSNDALQNNPQRSLACFEYYIPLINEIAETYENDFKACIAAAEDAQSAAEAATADDRDALGQTVAVSCSALSQCAEAGSATDTFQCYIDEAAGGAKTLYGVSTQATVELAALQESLRRIESDESVCTTETKIQYEKQSAEAYENFNSCILGNSEVPTTTAAPSTTPGDTTEPTTTPDPTTVPPTTPSTTVEPTTEEPTTVAPTTAEPTTVEPTTAVPTTLDPTTVAPTTAEPTTVEPTTAAPTTLAPTTVEPTTVAPTTTDPTTVAPTTAEPTTVETTTAAPTTVAPTTVEPTTVAPTTAEPTTTRPTEPTDPTDPTTQEQITTDPTTTGPVDGPIEVMPEEDIYRLIRRLRKLRV